MGIVYLQIEIEAAALATAVASYPAGNTVALAGANQWSHADSKPAAAVETAKEVLKTIRRDVYGITDEPEGEEPNGRHSD